MNRSTQILAWIWISCACLACEPEIQHVAGKQCRVELRVHTPPAQNTMTQVSSLQLTLKVDGRKNKVMQIDLAAPAVTLESAPADLAVLRLEGLGIDGQTVLASGESAPFRLDPEQPAVVDLLFARTGEFARLNGSLNHARFGHTVTLMSDGRVLIFGGASAGSIAHPSVFEEPEIYDPRNQQACGGAETPCPSYSGSDLRTGHVALASSFGTVLIFGGEDEQGVGVAPILVLDTTTSSFHELANYDLSQVKPRSNAAGTVFSQDDGTRQGFRETMLICGGDTVQGGLRQAQANALLFDAQAQTFVRTDLSLAYPRSQHSATAFSATQNRVLIAGGKDQNGLIAPIELFDGQQLIPVPLSGKASGSLHQPRIHHAALPFQSGVLVLGGENGLFSLDAPEWFTLEHSQGTGMLALEIKLLHQEHRARTGALAASLPSGEVLYGGGEHNDGFTVSLLGTMEKMQLLPDALDVGFFGDAPMLQPLSFSPMVVLPGGGLLFLGGWKAGADAPVASDEIWYYNPG